MRLAKYLAHAGVASRRAAERLIADGRVRVGGEQVTDPARDVGDQRRRARRRPPSGDRAARVLPPAQADRRHLHRQRPPGARDGDRAGGLRRAPLSRRAARRRQQRPRAADQRRRAREPADAPPLRGAAHVPRARGGIALEARAAGSCARGWSSRTGARSPARVRVVSSAAGVGARRDDPRGPQQDRAPHARGGRIPRARRSSGSRSARWSWAGCGAGTRGGCARPSSRSCAAQPASRPG